MSVPSAVQRLKILVVAGVLFLFLAVWMTIEKPAKSFNESVRDFRGVR